jgi:hypothetical protein
MTLHQHTMKHLARTALGGSALALVLGLAGCSTPSFHAEYAQRLDASQQRLANGELAAANRDLVGMLDSMREKGASDYALQRFLTVDLLARVHERASYDGAFWTEDSTSGTSLGSTSRERPAPTRHTVASTYWAGRLLELAPGVRSAARTVKGVDLAPGALADVDSANGTLYARMLLVAAYARLGYSTPARELLIEVPEFASTERRADEAAAALLDSLSMPVATQAWVFLEAHRHHRDANELNPELAYRYGIRARTATEGSTGSRTGLGENDEVVAWTEGLAATGSFQSSKGTPFGPYVQVCEESGENALDFVFYRGR